MGAHASELGPAPEAARPVDSLLLPLVFARLFIAGVSLVPLALGFVAWTTIASEPAPADEGPLMLIVFSIVAGLSYVGGAAIYLCLLRFTAWPWAYAIGAYFSAAFAVTGALFGFVAAMLYLSFAPYAASMVVTYAVILAFWPRRTAWQDALASRAAERR